MEKIFSRSRLRVKGQITVPTEIRIILGAEEGDELIFLADESGRVYLEKVNIIPPEQAWFWSDRWQRMEKEVQADLRENKIRRYDSTEEALNFLSQFEGEDDAEDHLY